MAVERSGRPQGRDQIVAAVIGAATTLFAQRGPAAVSLREVAAAADVTLSQIHRHIGNKDALLLAVFEADVTAAPTPVGAVAVDLPTFLKAFIRIDAEPSTRTLLQSRTVLDGFDLPALQERFPGIELAVALLARELPEDEARVRAAVLATLVAGWQLLGPTYLRVTGAPDVTPERFAAIMAPVLDAIAEAPPSR